MLRLNTAMPETLATITALIVERPLCVNCLAGKLDLPSRSDLDERLERIRRVLDLRREEGRCRACGTMTTVVSVGRPS
jgi:hypothetical protein